MEEFWPILPGPQKENYTKLYRGYKRLINTISEKLRKGDVLVVAHIAGYYSFARLDVITIKQLL